MGEGTYVEWVEEIFELAFATVVFESNDVHKSENVDVDGIKVRVRRSNSGIDGEFLDENGLLLWKIRGGRISVVANKDKFIRGNENDRQ